MTEPLGAGPSLPVFALQFRDAYLHDCLVQRVEQAPNDVLDGPALQIAAVGSHVQEDDRVLVASIGAQVSVPFNEAFRLVIACQTSGQFVSQDPIGPEQARAFLPTAFVLIYPYLRAHVAELARMTGLAVPTLPTIDAAATQELVDNLMRAEEERPTPVPPKRPARKRK